MARADIRGRQGWRSWQSGLDPQRLVLIDKAWVKTNIARVRSWGPIGKRLRGSTPQTPQGAGLQLSGSVARTVFRSARRFVSLSSEAGEFRAEIDPFVTYPKGHIVSPSTNEDAIFAIK